MLFSGVFVTFPYGVLGQVWYFYRFLIIAFFINLNKTRCIKYNQISTPVLMYYKEISLKVVGFFVKAFAFPNEYLNCDLRFPTMWYVRPAKAQTILRIRAV